MADVDAIAATARVVVRPWRVADADRFFDMYRRPEVTDWLGARPMVDRDEAVAMIGRAADRLAVDPRYGSWAVMERASGLAVGSVLLKPLPDGAGEVEIGWQMHPDSWGRGLATEAAGAVLARGFEYGLDEVWAVTYVDNHRSARVCDNLGMRLLGITHRWYDHPSLMFWIGAHADRGPSIEPDEPALADGARPVVG
ncbi:MAG TPA: GNAT family N-acetyltransferase [Solirubrobacteraceae bacterium]